MKKGKKLSPTDRRVVFRLLSDISRYKGRLLLSILCALATVLLTLYFPILTGEAVDRILGEKQVDFSGIRNILLLMGGSVLLTGLFQWCMNQLNNSVVYRVVADLRTRTFDHLSELPVAYLDRHPAGDLTSRVITDIDTLAQGLLMGFTQLFTGVLTIFGTLFFMFRINVWITLLVIVLTPLSFFVAGEIARRSYHLFREQSENRGKITAYTEEMLRGLKVIKTFGREEQAGEKFREINRTLSACSLKATFVSSLVNPATRCVNSIVYAAVGLSGAMTALHGLLSVGELVAFLSYANQYTKPFNEISGVVTELENAIASTARVYAVLDEKPLETDPSDRILGENSPKGVIEGEVSIEKLWFSYDKTKKLLTDINLKAKPGETVAIVGPTGCGKSTLINLLMRFYEPDQGQIRMDGCDIAHVTRESLRNNVSMVLQETWLRSGTIRENIAYGKPEASLQEIQEAARLAHCDSFIQRLEKGYDTVLGEDGGSLSAGQKQLLCIARLMLRLPPMLILDEATSSIDTRTELKIQSAFDRMMEGRTAFIVAHRLSTIRNADLILVMRDGNIVEQGKHEELLVRGGFYRELYQAQFSGGTEN